MEPRPSTQAPAAPFNAAPMLPEQFGRYRIVKKLGQGGMGAVYLAHDTQLDRPVALKVPHIAAEDSPATLQRFQREARAAAALDHPNLCRVYDVGTQNDVPFLTMAYVEGRTLAEVIKRDKLLPQTEAAGIVHKLALAMHEAHAKGIIHRDLKPSNVMINPRGEPVVMDFGLARQSNRINTRVTRPGALMGTPSYMPPEQVRGDVDAMGPGCDIYSLGVILYQLLTGHVPFEGPMDVVLGQILTQPPSPPSSYRPDLDLRLEAICLEALRKDIASRHASMAELAEDLTSWLRAPTQPVAAAPPLQSTMIETPAESLARSTGVAQTVTRVPTAAERQQLAERRSAGAARKVKRVAWRPGPKHWVGAGVVALGTLLLYVGMAALRATAGPVRGCRGHADTRNELRACAGGNVLDGLGKRQPMGVVLPSNDRAGFRAGGIHRNAGAVGSRDGRQPEFFLAARHEQRMGQGRL